MSRLFLLSIIIILTLSAPTSALPKFLDTILVSIKKFANLGLGGLDFVRQIIEYRLHELPDTTPNDRQEYDFIVVGAGSAGAVIASRLTEIENLTVLLIEAGGHENLIIDVPVFAVFIQLWKPINWAYTDGPSDAYCLGMTNRICHVAMGRGMGGTSSLNYMLAIRGNKHDYDEWADYTGDPSWSYEGMLKYFKKLEMFDVKGNIEDEFHNHDGPMRLTNVPFIPPLATSFVEAGEELGYPTFIDYNGRSQRGFSLLQTNQINGERLSTNRAYLWPAKGRKNLHVSMNSFVNKVIIDPVTKTARGVEFTKFGRKIEVFAKKEVILSAGAISSPKILMLSGVGPAEHLKSFNISVMQDAPVGERMTDHISYGGLSFLINTTEGIVIKDLFSPTDMSASDYIFKREGPLTTPGSISGLGYVNVDDPESERPNIELMFGISSLLAGYIIHVPFAISHDSYERYLANQIGHHSWLIWPLLMKPKSRGRISLKSSDPKVHPEIIANYLSDPDDVRVFVKGIRKAIEVSQTKSMQKFNSRLIKNTVPGCERHEPDSDDYWECAARTFTFTMWHHSGTCRMGKENDTTAVVNSKLQVKGIRNLRVADASIMPNIVTAHINIPTIAIAEKFSDVLKADHGYI